MTVQRLAAVFLGLSAALHVGAVLLAGFSPASLPLLAAGILYGLLAWWFYRRQWRWLAWLLFVMLLVNSIVALAMTGPGNPISDIMSYLIVIANYLCAGCLFVVLWRTPHRYPSDSIGARLND